MRIPCGLSLLLLALSAVSCSAEAPPSAAPQTPKVERVKPLDTDPSLTAPGVFFADNLERITDLKQSFQDLGISDGRFGLSTADAFSGRTSIQQTYVPRTEYGKDDDPGGAGWCMRFFGDNPHLPRAQEHKPHRTVVARWYHKFEEGFTARDGHFPNKMARLRCFKEGDWSLAYIVYFWVDGKDGHISIERETKAPGAHREWLPNHYTNFTFAQSENVGRWVHYELRVALGEGRRSDRIQAWADGRLICDVENDDLASGYTDFTPNGMSWDCYWNGGSPRQQSRYYDDLVLSTQPVGPARTGLNPTLVKSAFQGAGGQQAWEMEVAQGVQQAMVPASTDDGTVTRYRPLETAYTVVWQGTMRRDCNEMTVDSRAGVFIGLRKGAKGLQPNTLHFVRVRQQDTAGRWSAWSGWHAGFATDWAPGTAHTTPAGYRLEAAP